ncbi:Protein-disulfide isomerase [Paracoccus halophilus]|uniref:Protein-disulfide isomerase n=1 Tax=Paracoccus halophilus TaxID=376733 RepID=A0A099F0D4_9RHOB|nr:DsbA family protein [Paracoccus halophilus]KGJ03919.1 thiol-disulfide oxidoreductase [Paracoccus halophilus]SFA56604.1 Protein-disulfide isomerase [Paracoccus halophilus]
MKLHRRSLIAAVMGAMTVSALPAFAQDAQSEAGDAGQMPEGRMLPDIAMGNEDAPVTIIEYASFTCSHCGAFYQENWPRLKSEYIETGKVRFIQRDIYFDGVGLWAGILARCAGDDKYYAMSDMLFSQQKTWLDASNGDEIAANLRKIGTAAGLTEEQMDSCWADKQKIADLVTTFQQNATADEIDGTPTFMIAGEKVQNQPWPDLKKIIDAKLAEAGQQG